MRNRRRDFLLPSISMRLVVESRRDDDLEEDLGHAPGRLAVDRAVEGDDAAESRNRVAAQRLVERRRQVASLRQSTGNGVLDDGHGRLGEPSHGVPGGVRVEEVVERQLLAGQLFRLQYPLHRLARPQSPVGGGSLLRVLTVAQRPRQPAREGDLLGPLLGIAQVLRDDRVVGRGVGKRLRRQGSSSLGRQSPVAAARPARRCSRPDRSGRRPRENSWPRRGSWRDRRCRSAPARRQARRRGGRPLRRRDRDWRRRRRSARSGALRARSCARGRRGGPATRRGCAGAAS